MPGDEEKIKAQVKEAEELIEREAKQCEMDEMAANEGAPPSKSGDADPPEIKEEDARTVDTVGTATNGDQPPSPKIAEDTNMKDVLTSAESEEKEVPAEPSEAVKDHGDNGEEVVEGEEDTVIY